MGRRLRWWYIPLGILLLAVIFTLISVLWGGDEAPAARAARVHAPVATRS